MFIRSSFFCPLELMSAAADTASSSHRRTRAAGACWVPAWILRCSLFLQLRDLLLQLALRHLAQLAVLLLGEGGEQLLAFDLVLGPLLRGGLLGELDVD